MQKLEGVVADLRKRLPQRRTRRLSQPHSQLLMTEDEDVNYLHNAFWKNVNVQVSVVQEMLVGLVINKVSSRKPSICSHCNLICRQFRHQVRWTAARIFSSDMAVLM